MLPSTSASRGKESKINKRLSPFGHHLKLGSNVRSSIFSQYNKLHPQIASQAGGIPLSTASLLNIDTHFAQTIEEEPRDEVPVKRSSTRERLFLALHKPAGFTCGYHLCLNMIIMISCVVLNLLRPKIEVDDEYLSSHYDSIHFTMTAIDSLLSGMYTLLFLLLFYCNIYNRNIVKFGCFQSFTPTVVRRISAPLW